VRTFKTIEELRAELVAFARRYNETWLVARHGYKTPARSERSKPCHEFGLLFAYDSDLEWGDLVQEIQSFSDSNPRSVLCNAVYILKKGFFLNGDGTNAYKLNPHIEQLPTIQIHGYPDRDSSLLYHFTASLLVWLRMTDVSPPNFDRYFRLPFVAGERSYGFSLGMFSEVGRCPEHGDYPRQISEENLKRLSTGAEARSQSTGLKQPILPLSPRRQLPCVRASASRCAYLQPAQFPAQGHSPHRNRVEWAKGYGELLR
jgi:hypothetical protein